MTLIKRNRLYHARYKSQEGKIVSVPLKETDRDKASAVWKEKGGPALEAAAKHGRLSGEIVTRAIAGKRITIERAIVEWEKGMQDTQAKPRTVENSVSTVRRWATEMHLLNLTPISVTPKHVSQWINNPKSDNKLASRRIALSIISTFLTYCTYVGWNLGNQAKLVRVNLDLLSHEQKETTVRQCFTRGEISTLLKHLDGFWKFAVMLGDETGLRLGDIAQIEWACFEKDGKAIVWTDKRDKRVAVPISHELKHMLTEIPIESTRYMFPEQRAIALDPARRAILSTQFSRLCVRHGIEGKSFHCLRYGAISRWRREFEDEGLTYEQAILKIGKLVGHSNRKTTEGYDRS